MKANRTQVEQALDRADPAIRLYLLHGPDEAASRALAKRLGKALGDDAERIDLTGLALKADPARLADEAAAIALFGGPRYILIDPAGDEMIESAEALIQLAAAGNPVIAIAGTLRKDSKLLKLATAEKAALALASYPPEGREADRLAINMGQEHGLRMRPEIAHRLALASGQDRAVLAQELAKFADFLDATPDAPRDLEHDAVDLLGADSEDADVGTLVQLTLAGDAAGADAELARLAGLGTDAIPIVRAFQRQLLQLAELAAVMAEGNSAETAMGGAAGRAIFWKDKDRITRLLARWRPEAIAKALERMAAAGRLAMRSGGPGQIAVAAEINALARHAARLR